MTVSPCSFDVRWKICMLHFEGVDPPDIQKLLPVKTPPSIEMIRCIVNVTKTRLMAYKFKYSPEVVKSLLQSHPHLFYPPKEYENWIKASRLLKNRDYKLGKKHGMTAKQFDKVMEQKKIIKEKEQWKKKVPDERCPFLNCYPPFDGSANGDGDFQPNPDLEPGEFTPLRLANDDKVFRSGGRRQKDDNIWEAGLPNPQFWTKFGKDYPYLEGFASTMMDFVGPYRKKSKDIMGKKEEKLLEKEGWLVHKGVSTKDSDITFVYPATEEKLKELLYKVDEGGQLGKLLRNAAGLLGVKQVAIFDVNFIFVTWKQFPDNNLHTDLEERYTSDSGTLLIPLQLPNSMHAELAVEGDNEKDLKAYKYRQDRATFFRSYVKHNSNTFGPTRQPRIMLSMQFGHYTKEQWTEELRKKSFWLPPGKNFKKDNTWISAQRWQADHLLSFDENDKISFPGAGEGLSEKDRKLSGADVVNRGKQT